MTKIRGEEWQLKAPLVSYLIVRLGMQLRHDQPLPESLLLGASSGAAEVLVQCLRIHLPV